MLTLRGLTTAVIVLSPFAGAVFAVSGNHAFLTGTPSAPGPAREHRVDAGAMLSDMSPREALRLDREMVVLTVPSQARPGAVIPARLERRAGGNEGEQTGFARISERGGAFETTAERTSRDRAAGPESEAPAVEQVIQSSSGSQGLSAGP
ncbi:MAG TPA: hypothetical protein VL123_09780 [Candidatus Udaeobacter sp.]|nr:hypothetical protein [Candidatus Udaeobacter sp.]